MFVGLLSIYSMENTRSRTICYKGLTRGLFIKLKLNFIDNSLITCHQAQLVLVPRRLYFPHYSWRSQSRLLPCPQ